MRKIIGIGETILDIIFRNNQPQRAVPGGSTFNCMVSLGRCGLPVLFISELGQDKVGDLIRSFMEENNLSTAYSDLLEEGKSPVSLAFLDDKQQAEYVFYTDFPEKRLNIAFPPLCENDLVIFGSYFAVNPVLREKVKRFLQYVKEQRAIVYYDINFRKAHEKERLALMDSFLENFQLSTVVRCSEEDLAVLFPGLSIADIYNTYFSVESKPLIVTRGKKPILLKTPFFEKEYAVEALIPVSTIGSGDNFNAGFAYALIQNNFFRDDLNSLSENQWDQLIEPAKAFASEVCLSMDNYISREFAQSLVLHK
ncbi:MAG: PfkB family carbohydrate kinase [Candidatus Azobacteroides sp.]|nr:PfkB family carbohydrate kinase [Candidatus Azobacteroides sp.]